MSQPHRAPVSLPRVAITYCTQCRWLLRAAYFGQELLSTFGTQIGEIALVPATGGLFTVELTYVPGKAQGEEASENDAEPVSVLLWDRKAEAGFPETKVLKQLVRDHIDPTRDLGHSDKGGKKKAVVAEEDEKKAVTAVEEQKAVAVEDEQKSVAAMEDEQTAEEQEAENGGVSVSGVVQEKECEDCK